jgi:hypothetical protein
MPSIPGMKISSHNYAVARPFEQKLDGGLDGAVIVHDQNFRHGPHPCEQISHQFTVVYLLPMSRKPFLGIAFTMSVKGPSEVLHMHGSGHSDRDVHGCSHCSEFCSASNAGLARPEQPVR